jgi:hypothetical protein
VAPTSMGRVKGAINQDKGATIFLAAGKNITGEDQGAARAEDIHKIRVPTGEATIMATVTEATDNAFFCRRMKSARAGRTVVSKVSA